MTNFWQICELERFGIGLWQKTAHLSPGIVGYFPYDMINKFMTSFINLPIQEPISLEAMFCKALIFLMLNQSSW